MTSWAGLCPEEHLQAYADLQTAMNRDVPTGGMTREAVELDVERVRRGDQRLAENYLSLVVLATTTDGGEPAGYTQMFVPKADPENVMQDDTLVLRAHRGHGLGARMKAANLRLLPANHPTDADCTPGPPRRTPPCNGSTPASASPAWRRCTRSSAAS